MKKLRYLIAVLCLAAFNLHAEDVPVEQAIKWSYKVEFTGADEANVVITAKLFHHYHLFSLLHDPMAYDFTGTPTLIQFKKSPEYQLIGKIRESNPVRGSDDMGSYVWHMEKAVFTQKIKLKTQQKFDLHFSVDWQICNETMCYPPTQDKPTLTIDPSKGSAAVNSSQTETVTPSQEETPVDPTTNTDLTESVVNAIRGTCEMPEELDSLPVSFGVRANKLNDQEYELIFVVKGEDGWRIPSGKDGLFRNVRIKTITHPGFSVIGSLEAPETESYYDSVYKKKIAFYPLGSEFRQRIRVDKGKDAPVVNGTIAFQGLSDTEYYETEALPFTYNLENAVMTTEDDPKRSYWAIFGLAFLGGLAALLTPCVFPMIPMTVSFFLKQSKSKSKGVRNALVYSLSIIAIYVTLGLFVTLVFGENALNAMSTNIYMNIFFFLLLVVFGASFLGAFEIRLPNSWINKVDSRADRGGLLGIFFMAFTLALVSFSCTGPIIGTLLVATSKGLMGPFIGMLGFSLALALPFGLFSAFPAWLNSMPQSGGWLNSVKVVLGFLEIALAFKFLSNADLVIQAHLLEREVFIAFWIVIFFFLGYYLVGKLRFSHDSEMHFVGVPRFFMSIVVFAFVVYMIPGMWGAPLKILSGFLPPRHYSEIPYGIGGAAPKQKLPEHAYYGPHGIPVFHDYDHAKHYADSVQKPLMLDFTGHACINCRKMEDQVWSTELVKPLLVDSVVVVSLHVDEKTALPASEQFKDDRGNLITNVGDKWSYLQRVRYHQQTQPQYILLDKDENKMLPSTTYSADGDLIEDFKQWLDDGVSIYESRINMVSLKGSGLVKPKTCIDPENAAYYADMYFELYGEKYLK